MAAGFRGHKVIVVVCKGQAKYYISKLNLIHHKFNQTTCMSCTYEMLKVLCMCVGISLVRNCLIGTLLNSLVTMAIKNSAVEEFAMTRFGISY